MCAAGNVLRHLNPLLDVVLVLSNEIADEAVIDHLGTVEVGQEKPDEQTKTDPVPVWNEVEDEAEESLGDVENTVHHPVGEPDFVVITTIVAFNGTDGVHGGVEDSDRGDEDSPSLHQHQDQERDRADTSKNESRVDISLGAEVNEDWYHSGIWVQNGRILLKSFLDFVHRVGCERVQNLIISTNFLEFSNSSNLH